MYCTPPETSQVTFSPLEFGSRELTIPKRSQLESPGIYHIPYTIYHIPSKIYLYIYPLRNPRDSHRHHHHLPSPPKKPPHPKRWPWNTSPNASCAMRAARWGFFVVDFLFNGGFWWQKWKEPPKKMKKGCDKSILEVWMVCRRCVNLLFVWFCLYTMYTWV